MAKLSKRFHSAHPLLQGLAVSALATGVSLLLPGERAAEAIALVFLVSTYLLALSPSTPHAPAHYGLELGGLLEAQPLSATRIFRATSRAFLLSAGLALFIFPLFWLGFVLWYQPHLSFEFARSLSFPDGQQGLLPLLNLSLAHLLVVALPEEAFFRGYLQTSLEDRSSDHKSFFGLSWPIVLSSALFALGHVATTPQLSRLAVFFPSLLFGLLRKRSGGIGASVFFHAFCNVFSALLAQGYGLA